MIIILFIQVKKKCIWKRSYGRLVNENVTYNQSAFFSGFIGYASDLYGVVSSHDIRNDEDDQLYYSQIYINKELRNKYKMKLDTHSRIFQNLNGQFGELFIVQWIVITVIAM